MDELTIIMTFNKDEIRELSETTGLIIETDKESLVQAVRTAVNRYVEENHKPFNILYEDNTGDDCYYSFSSKEEAEKFIDEELERAKEFYVENAIDCSYVDSYNCNGGFSTEIYEKGGDNYNRWIRKWM